MSDRASASAATRTTTARIERQARPEQLGAFLDFVVAACANAGLSKDDAFAVRLAAEEACANVIAHAYDGAAPGLLALSFARDGPRVVLTVEDDGTPFDASSVSPPALDAPAETRPIGGLGWHLIRQMMDEIRHERSGTGGNRLVLVKCLSDSANPQET